MTRVLHGCPRCWGNLVVCSRFAGRAELTCETCGFVLEGNTPELSAVLRVSELWAVSHSANTAFPLLRGGAVPQHDVMGRLKDEHAQLIATAQRALQALAGELGDQGGRVRRAVEVLTVELDNHLDFEESNVLDWILDEFPPEATDADEVIAGNDRLRRKRDDLVAAVEKVLSGEGTGSGGQRTGQLSAAIEMRLREVLFLLQRHAAVTERIAAGP